MNWRGSILQIMDTTLSKNVLYVTEEARRIDFAVIKDDEVIKSVEVTSERADKIAQMAKEDRIREAGGNYIVDRRTGEVVPFAHGVKTEVVRRV